MTQFALTIWAYQETGSATALGVLNTAFILPFLLLSPVAGVMVDRYNRKLMMAISDLTAVVATGGILTLLAAGRLEIWHLAVASAVNGLGNTFQWPAYSAAISTMVSKEHYGRANGMMSLVESGPAVLAPLLAGALLPLIHLVGILTLDVLTFFLAIGALLLVHVPQPARTAEGQAGEGSLLKEALYGFRYIFARRGLLGLLLFFICLNFIIGLSFSLFAPMILARTGNNSAVLGTVQSAAAVGAVIGGLLISLWGGFKRRMTSIFLGEALTAFFGLFLFGLARGLPGWIAASVLGSIFPSFTNGAGCAGTGFRCPAYDCLVVGAGHAYPGGAAGRLCHGTRYASRYLAGGALRPAVRRWPWRGDGAAVCTNRGGVYGGGAGSVFVCAGSEGFGR